MLNDPFVSGTSLDDRLVSSFPLSLPTAACFESIFPPRMDPYDKDRKIPDKVNIHEYSAMYMNVFTLFRNLVNVVPKETFLKTSPKELAEVLSFELEVINSLLSNEGQGTCTAYPYVCSYDKLYLGKVSKYISTRNDTTDWQHNFKAKFMQTVKILSEWRKAMGEEIMMFDTEIVPIKKTNALMITHVPYDLLSQKNFSKLDLLESHTGVLKTKHKWNTKYYPVGDEDLSMLPFTTKLLAVFGDKILIRPMDMKLRRLILSIAKNRSWVPTTTNEKINYDLNLDIKEPLVLDVLRSL
jgi:hypothetical protein